MTRLAFFAASTIARPSEMVRRQRLLAVDVLLGLAGGHEVQGVPVVGRGDDDGVEVLAVEQLAEVGVGIGLAAGLLAGGEQVGLVDVADGGDLAIVVRQEGVEQLVAAIADADEAEADALVGAEDRARPRRRSGRPERRRRPW